MNHKISAAVLIFKEDKLLLVKHVNPTTRHTWWVPPGGGLEADETLFAAAQREAFEEAGLRVVAGRVVYVRQYVYTEQQENLVTFYLLADKVIGEISLENIHTGGPDKDYIKEVKYFSQEELAQINVYPRALRDQVWEDRKEGFSCMKFLGVESDRDT